MSGQESWPYHFSLSQESFDSRVRDGLPIRPAEAMKPTAHAIRDLRMAYKRSLLLDQLFSVLLAGHDPKEVREDPMMIRWVEQVEWDQGQKTVERAEKYAIEIWGKDWWLHRDIRIGWQTVFDCWWDGTGWNRQKRAALDNLPDSVKEKLS